MPIRTLPFKILLFCGVASSSRSMDSKTLSSAISNFSYKFCNELPPSQSSVASPLSAEILLALVALGSSNVGHEELLKALNFPDDNSIRASFSSLAASLKAEKGVTLNVANKIYIKEGDYDLLPQIKDDAVKVFDAAIEKINFEAPDTAKAINTWVESKTNNRIKDLLKQDDFNSLTRLVLVNALYFKGSWKKQFNSKLTKDTPFHVTKSSTIDIPMMYISDHFKYGESETLDAQLLELPYIGDGASMLVVLPRQVDGLPALLARLAAGHDLAAELARMHSGKVDVTLPKFKIETEIDLGDLLPKLGIKDIFNSGSSCVDRVLSNGEALYVSKAVQKAFIEVNEEGAEAAAATAMGFMMMSAMIAPPPTPRFVADRPFLTAILVGRSPAFIATFHAIGIAFCSAMLAPPPTPLFVADRPFLAAVLVGRSPAFLATFHGN